MQSIIQAEQEPRLSVAKLTGLWAFSECALGGMLHLFQVPFSGFLLAAFAVVIICCISMYSDRPFRDILYATLVAMTVKLLLSPHTPLTAYVAVAFQGLAGAVICSLPIAKAIKFPVFGIIALVESALQKIIILTILFGKSIWEAIDALFAQLLPGLQYSWSISALLILLYASIYAVWGIIVGVWAAGIPAYIRAGHHKTALTGADLSEPQAVMKRKFRKNLLVFAALYLLALFAAYFYFPGDRLFAVLLRPFLILTVWYFIINPLFRWLLASAYRQDRAGLHHWTEQIKNEIPFMRMQARRAYAAARANHRGLAFVRHFLIYLIYLVCLHDPAQS